MMESVTLFDDRAGEDTVQVWITTESGAFVLRTQEWGEGIERHFGYDTIETWLTVPSGSVTALAERMRADQPDLADADTDDVEAISRWLMGDSAASAHIRMRLDELGMPYEFHMR
jgi:hypothetical protein